MRLRTRNTAWKVLVRGAQMGHGPQEFQAVPLFLQGVVRRGRALPPPRTPPGAQRVAWRPASPPECRLPPGPRPHSFWKFPGNYPDYRDTPPAGGEKCAIVKDNEAEGLAGPDGAHPAAYGDGLSRVERRVSKQLPDADRFHMHTTSLCLNLCG